jgi:Zn-dependent protease with chaperone function
LKLFNLASKKLFDVVPYKLLSKLLKQPNPSGAFSFVTLFNLQGTRPQPLSRRVFMITYRFRFVKTFFQVFSNFFEALSSFATRFVIRRRSLERLIKDTTLSFACQALFSNFLKKFFDSQFEPFGLPCLFQNGRNPSG